MMMELGSVLLSTCMSLCPPGAQLLASSQDEGRFQDIGVWSLFWHESENMVEGWLSVLPRLEPFVFHQSDTLGQWFSTFI